MSSTFPPDGPQGPGPEYLEQGGGTPAPHSTTPREPRSRKPALVAGGAIAGLLLVGGGIWAATWYFSTGAQPAEALPDTTLGYVSIDLDPSGQQKIEALKTLNKFPAIKEQLGLDASDDVREKVFEEFAKGTGCDLDFGKDVEPWLGNRAAVAAVNTGEDQPAPVFVVQVTDADKADEGMGKIRECTAGTDGGETSGGWAIDGDWAVIAETDDIAQGVVDDAKNAPLTDNADYQNWTDQVGDAGIINAYAAPSAGDYLAEHMDDFGFPFGSSGSASSCAVAPGTDPSACDDYEGSTEMLMPSEVTDALKDFQGMAATVRFNDGALELEAAGDPGVQSSELYASEGGDDVLATLPEDTAAAFGVGFEDGWFTQFVDQMAAYSGENMSAEDMMSDMEQESGLDLPADAETLLGDSAAVSLGSDFDVETFFNSSDGSDFPVAAKIQGDPDAIEGVLDKIRGDLTADEANMFGSDADGEAVAIGPNADYRSQVLEDGNLGDSDVYQNVIRESDKASAVFFVNFDAGDWLTKAAGGDPEANENLEPLEGLGMSVWRDDDAAHSVIRLTTN